MDTTSVSLLERLRQPAQQDAWTRFVDLYTPLIYYWARRAGLAPEEAADLVQDVLTVLVQKLPTFQYDPHQSFRGWLRTVTLNKWRENRRRRGVALAEAGETALAGVECPLAEDAFWQVEYQQQLVGRALKLMQAEFQENTWKACWECVVEGKPAADVARELGLSVASVYAAKSRVLRRLREELAGLLD
jgi:RNA polymerase sigma-70 factor (ECF subfamily)